MCTAYETLINANKIGITPGLLKNDKLKYTRQQIIRETEATLKEIVAYKNGNYRFAQTQWYCK